MNLKRLYILLFPLLSLTQVSCDQCIGMFGKEKVLCSNGGTCNDGECDCLKGFSGPSCEELDLCELNDVECLYGGCVDGECFCQTGYEGETCQTETRAKFIGKYRVTEGCVPLDTIENLEIQVERGLLNGDRINIYNLFNASQFPVVGFFSSIEAQPETGKMSFKINNQEPDDNGRTISGSGEIDTSDSTQTIIRIDYTIINGAKEYTCEVEGYKFE